MKYKILHKKSLPSLVVLVYLIPQPVVIQPLVQCHWYLVQLTLGILVYKICLIKWFSPTLHLVLRPSKLTFLTCSKILLAI